ncbi:MAG: LPS export ABC transporter ATP-binding protein [Desulfovibrionaceae bacterium]
MAILEGITLQKIYGQKEVVRNISLTIRQGEVIGILGPNGAGKTTTFYMLTGIVKPTSGKVLLDGNNIESWPLYKRAIAGLSYLPQESSIFKKLTVEQNLSIVLEYTGLSKKEQKRKMEELLEDFRITHLAKSYASYLSGGERRRLEIARALVRDPHFILLDEPFAGIDPIAVLDIQEIINVLKGRNMGVLISDHNVRETLSVCDVANIVFQGECILTGTPEEISNNERAKTLYLGENFCL